MTNPLPTFLVLGAAKAGTTALHRYLGDHPDIFVTTPKETNYFALRGGRPRFAGPGDERTINSNSITESSDYLRLFAPGSGYRARGEASPLYLYSAIAPRRIATEIPDVRLIAILRNPVERAYSSYLYLVREGREHLSFEAALDAEAKRIEQNWEHVWHYSSMGFYAPQIKRYYAEFSRQQVLILLYEDLLRDPASVYDKVCRHIGVEPWFTPDLAIRHNMSIPKPRSASLEQILVSENRWKNVARAIVPRTLRWRLKEDLLGWNHPKPKMSLATRHQLVTLFRDDVQEVMNIVNRDLLGWLR